VAWKSLQSFIARAFTGGDMVIIGYGKFRNYTIQEIPDDFLTEISSKYPLRHESQAGAEYKNLQITIAIHEEIHRREKGGRPHAKQPSPRELAKKMVTKGYQLISKDHHPDRGGSDNTQKSVNAVRLELLKACDEIQDGLPEDALVIPDPCVSPITDEDIPF
jgi:hypothetical protein